MDLQSWVNDFAIGTQQGNEQMAENLRWQKGIEIGTKNLFTFGDPAKGKQ